MKIRYLLLPLIFLLFASSFVVAQPPLPCSITGLVTIDGTPIGGITVQVVNLDTGENQTTTTSYGNPPYEAWRGYYTVALTGQNGDTIKVTVTYGDTYSNTCVVNLGLVTQFCNLSISIGNGGNGDGGNGGSPGNGGDGDGGNGDEPPDENNETEEPEEPGNNETINGETPLYNLTVEVVDNTTGPISNASVTIYDNNETKITKSYTNETGEAVFLLEEGIYIIEIEKNSHPISFHTVSLLASMEYTAYMSTDENSSNTPCPCQQEDGFPVIYAGIVGAVAVMVAVFFFFYCKKYKGRR